MKVNKLVKEITSREKDFAQWYTDVCLKAELMDYSDAKGFIIYRPYGYAMWENIQDYLNLKFKESGHENVYMPLVIPENLFQKEKDHVEGFSPEVAYLTTDNNDTEEKLIVRPTSEVLFCEHYKKIINSYRDLPKKYNQWCNVVRWEKTTRPFLRGKEFLWQEGHTVHATEKEAREETLLMLDIYNKMGEELLAIPFVTGLKTEKEKFAGAIETYSIEALMHDGKALQSGTSHYLGKNFSKPFNIIYRDSNNQEQFVYQTSWGVSTRLLGAVIMVHGDDEGLVLPPYIAPTQVVIIPIQSKNEIVQKITSNLFQKLEKKNIRVKLDNQDKSPGWKFSEYEMKGVPIRIEIGPKDIEANEATIALRYSRERIKVPLTKIEDEIELLLKNIHEKMYQKALSHVEKNTHTLTDFSLFEKTIDKGGYIKMSVHDDAEEIIKDNFQASARVIIAEPLLNEICPVTNKKATETILFARAY
ncbi:MAG TPA: proline--tRNA ligase [Acholeplasmataceae bacterium]|nr:proline--tRNA ligase [Acholeplasmataceae bacterium]